MPYKTTNLYSPNFDNIKRPKKNIKFIIIHYTGMKSESESIHKLINTKSKVSCHYFIKKNGDLINMVPEYYSSWHAGKSSWKKYKLLNKNSIGIEISNQGHDYEYKFFEKKQMTTLINILKKIVKKYKIKKENILGHSDIAPDRKKDPGEKFNWQLLAKKKLCIWPNLDPIKIRKYRGINLEKNKIDEFYKNLLKIGYCKIFNKKKNRTIKILTIAFQRRFRQELVNGIIDLETFLISKNLVNKQ